MQTGFLIAPAAAIGLLTAPALPGFLAWLSAAGGALCAFTDVSAASGVGFVLRNSATPEKHQIETMVGGVAILDYDGDGRPDLYFVNGAKQPPLEKTGPEWWNRLYRNRGDFQFEDVTVRAGVAGAGHGIGTAAADYDNDGHTDLFVAGVNRNLLYRNRGDGTFEDVTARAGLAHAGPKPWSVAAAWFDMENDGDLDLFVVNYVHWDPGNEPFCGDVKGAYRTYCHPKLYTALPDILYRNNGDGTFTDISREAGIAQHAGKGMGVAVADYDADGDLDVFVANDTVPNFLFRNEGGGRFSEIAAQAGVAFNDDGRALSSMGVDFRDADGDGRPDLFVTALANETFPLFRNLGGGQFLDVTYPSRIGAATMPLSGWSNGIYDFNNDGRKDLFAANGDVNDNTELFSSRKSKQANLALVNHGDGTFVPVEVGPPAMHRGAAFGDLDGDGRVDVVLSRIGEAAVLLRNTSAGPHWLRLRLRGKRANRDAIGASVRVVTPDGEQWNHVTTSVGYACSSEREVHFGLGRHRLAELVEVRWPGGVVQKLEKVSGGRVLEITEP